ncbi:tetraacyldisaccharide 4'-kinase [Flavobacterium muglaense]|uniref:Tetraacyldisaccharide 4'-kinase n=1 Tax=Flavobacterium muglaense TaxID=2764716 RepID=A0A923SEP4_9FLAO|nr:tetraacyldisaccharide 4'-kinase [Flavobacterium muglaense]MBC5837299.1 tetraacyldisaccharide 4'-kinase [Flavobacterium muglaense]MBC5843777.1 tetraacyldisaccharide 4'-kinase [Flavobacterium muglaense]
MNVLRKILFPFAILYGIITSIRNFLFDIGVLKSTSFNIPVIAVGNLSVGGTGKSPQIEYLIRLLQDDYRVATLSRGYKRESEGYILADANASAKTIGDEPFQYFQKFKKAQVAVDTSRKNGIEQLLSQKIKPQLILLDDAYQHRKVKAGFYILLTSYGDLYADDFMLPTGNLRESRSGAARANVVIVTKCPETLSQKEQNQIQSRLKLTNEQELFFTAIAYDDQVYSGKEQLRVTDIAGKEKLLLAGIAKPQPFFAYLQAANDVTMVYPDHHHFTEKDITDIKNKAENKIIITTEKDYVRLKGSILEEQLYYLPIKSAFLNREGDFMKKIKNYVGESTRNS